MEDEKKRWSVTYTKHIKQKRKVYQDGYLDLYISSNKVMLYDDCEKLLECRILKTDEVVSSGETLTFNAYFVDVGDPEGDHKPLSDLNVQRKDKPHNHNCSFMRGPKFKNNSISSEDRKPNLGRNKAQLNSLSPSQKIIKEFKKSELQKYGVPQSCPDTATPSITEWQVLYTAQLTQKAKKYHDGYLQLAVCGSLRRQVKLFDASRKQLDGRFLKKDEVIRSGESVALDAHLVEIGELDGNHVQENSGIITEKTQIQHGQHNLLESNRSLGKALRKSEVYTCGAPEIGPDTTTYSTTEWQVMYTTQVTQKAKKYHDGFLQLANGGSLRRQVMLCDASKKVLSCRFLKKDEVIRPGESLAFVTYLVDIGEPELNKQNLKDLNLEGNNYNVAGKMGILHEQQLKADKTAVKAGLPQKSYPCSRKHADLLVNSSLSKSVSTNKPLRDAHQILSILKKPIAQESIADLFTDKGIVTPVSSTKKVQDSDAIKDFPDDGKSPTVLMPSERSCETVATGESSENVDVKNPSDSSISRAVPSSNQLSKDTDIANSQQPRFGNVEADSKRCEQAAGGFTSSGASAFNYPLDDDGISKELESASETNECPSFDLGF